MMVVVDASFMTVTVTSTASTPAVLEGVTGCLGRGGHFLWDFCRGGFSSLECVGSVLERGLIHIRALVAYVPPGDRGKVSGEPGTDARGER
jgi:hypothetical protein